MRNPPTTLFALVGQPVAGNPTWAMIEAACRSIGLEGGRYVSFDVSPNDLPAAVGALRTLRVAGFHVTIPHKVAVVEHLDRLTPAAEAVAAVNCVKPEDGGLVGDNTDGRGFIASLAALTPPAGSRILVLGAGGAARAVAVEAALAGAASVAIANRTPGRAVELATLVRRVGAEASVVDWSLPLGVPDGVNVVVNATSVGMSDSEEVVPVHWPEGAGRVAADVVIRSSTRFLEEAAAAGWTPLDGLGMLVEQAVAAFRWWAGREPDRDAMRTALADALA
jgi:shikimate dehydrogenase